MENKNLYSYKFENKIYIYVRRNTFQNFFQAIPHCYYWQNVLARKKKRILQKPVKFNILFLSLNTKVTNNDTSMNLENMNFVSVSFKIESVQITYLACI